MACAHINTKADFNQLIKRINNNTFDNEAIQIHFNDSDLVNNPEAWFDNRDLQLLTAAISSSKWCQNDLKELNISNNQFTILPDLKCENLAKLDINGTAIEGVRRIQLPNLESLDVSNTNSRVPPNLFKYPKLKELQILHKNPLSLLGIYSLLLQLNQKNMLDIPIYKNLAEHFIMFVTKNPPTDGAEVTIEELRKKVEAATEQLQKKADGTKAATEDQQKKEKMRLNFVNMVSSPEDYESELVSQADREFMEKVNISDFINNFQIPEFFFDDHVSFFMAFRERAYYIEPPADFATRKSPTAMFNQNLHLKTLNQEYIKALRIFGAFINGVLARPIDPKKPLTIDGIINATRTFTPTTYMPNLNSHTEFFWGQLQRDFDILRETFRDAGKPQHIRLLNRYERTKMKALRPNFDTKELILEQCKLRIKPSANVELEVNMAARPAKSPLNYFKMKKLTLAKNNEDSNPTTTNTESTATLAKTNDNSNPPSETESAATLAKTNDNSNPPSETGSAASKSETNSRRRRWFS